MYMKNLLLYNTYNEFKEKEASSGNTDLLFVNEAMVYDYGCEFKTCKTMVFIDPETGKFKDGYQETHYEYCDGDKYSYLSKYTPGIRGTNLDYQDWVFPTSGDNIAVMRVDKEYSFLSGQAWYDVSENTYVGNIDKTTAPIHTYSDTVQTSDGTFEINATYYSVPARLSGITAFTYTIDNVARRYTYAGTAYTKNRYNAPNPIFKWASGTSVLYSQARYPIYGDYLCSETGQQFGLLSGADGQNMFEYGVIDTDVIVPITLTRRKDGGSVVNCMWQDFPTIGYDTLEEMRGAAMSFGSSNIHVYTLDMGTDVTAPNSVKSIVPGVGLVKEEGKRKVYYNGKPFNVPFEWSNGSWVTTGKTRSHTMTAAEFLGSLATVEASYLNVEINGIRVNEYNWVPSDETDPMSILGAVFSERDGNVFNCGYFSYDATTGIVTFTEAVSGIKISVKRWDGGEGGGDEGES